MKTTRYFLLRQTYNTEKWKTVGDGTTRAIRDSLNIDMEYAHWGVVELTNHKKLSQMKLFNHGGGRKKGVKNKGNNP